MQAYGIDPSFAAVDICKRTLNFWARDIPSIRSHAHFLRADGCHLPFKAHGFDVIILSDILEHVSLEQKKSVLTEVRRVLKQTGKLVIHTSPQKFFIPLTGRLYSVISRILKWFANNGSDKSGTVPWNIRPLLPRGLQKNIHIGELSGYKLRRLLSSAGFRHQRIWLEPNPHYIDYLFQDRRALKILRGLHSIVPIDHLFFSELYAVAEPDRRMETD
jgi:SAM-dependent methyltransferase